MRSRGCHAEQSSADVLVLIPGLDMVDELACRGAKGHSSPSTVFMTSEFIPVLHEKERRYRICCKHHCQDGDAL